MTHFHTVTSKTEYDHNTLTWGCNDYYIFRELMGVLGINVGNSEGNFDFHDSSDLYFSKKEWEVAIKRLKNYDNETEAFKNSVFPFINRDVMISEGIEDEPWDEIPTLDKIIKYMEFVLKNSPNPTIQLEWW